LPPRQRRTELAKAADLKLQESKATDEQERVDIRTRYLQIEKEIDSIDKGRHARRSTEEAAARHPPPSTRRRPRCSQTQVGNRPRSGATLNNEHVPTQISAQFKGRGADRRLLRAQARLALAKSIRRTQTVEEPLFHQTSKPKAKPADIAFSICCTRRFSAGSSERTLPGFADNAKHGDSLKDTRRLRSSQILKAR
jgi:hypothetical protein